MGLLWSWRSCGHPENRRLLVSDERLTRLSGSGTSTTWITVSDLMFELYRSEGKKMCVSPTGCAWVPPTDVFQRSVGFKGAKNDTITAEVACKRILIRLQRPLGDSGPFGKHFDEEDDHQQLQPLDMENAKHMRSMGFSDGLIMMPLVPWNTTSFEPQNPSCRPAQHERRRSASPLGM